MYAPIRYIILSIVMMIISLVLMVEIVQEPISLIVKVIALVSGMLMIYGCGVMFLTWKNFYIILLTENIFEHRSLSGRIRVFCVSDIIEIWVGRTRFTLVFKNGDKLYLNFDYIISERLSKIIFGKDIRIVWKNSKR